MRGVRILLAGAMAVTALTSAPNAWACRCYADPLHPGYVPAMAKPVTASVSFVGVAQGARQVDPLWRAWSFDVEVPLAGLPADGTEIELFNDGDAEHANTCEMAFDEGTRYHVWGDPGPNGTVRIAPCSADGFSTVP